LYYLISLLLKIDFSYYHYISTQVKKAMPFILSNGDVCDDEEIYGSHIHEYDVDVEFDDDEYEDPIASELIDKFEFRLAMTAH